MALGSIPPGNLISIVALQSLLLRGFERLVFRSPAVPESLLGGGRFAFILRPLIRGGASTRMSSEEAPRCVRRIACP